MKPTDKIYIAGMNGMVGSAIHRKLKGMGFSAIVGPSSTELDLRDQTFTNHFFAQEKPDYVFMAAARVGGILANDTHKASFLYDNLMIQSNVIHASYQSGVKKLLFLGSSCIYPKLAPQPLKEESLLTGSLEPTNEPYAIAKIAGIKLCDTYRHQYGSNFISVMPCNLYGPNDRFDLQNSHVLPALIKKIHAAKIEHHPKVEIWGTGSPLRELMHVDDLANACVHMMDHYNGPGFMNAGSGQEISIRDLASLISSIVGFDGDFIFDPTKPDGTPRKILDSSRLHQLGWKPAISLEKGIREVYEHFLFSSS